MLKRIFLLIAALQSGLALAEPVYLLTSFTVRGTPVTKAVLLQDRNVQSLEKCQVFVRQHIRGTERGRNY